MKNGGETKWKGVKLWGKNNFVMGGGELVGKTLKRDRKKKWRKMKYIRHSK